MTKRGVGVTNKIVIPAEAGIPRLVIPAEAGIQGFQPPYWTPAFAGVTRRGAGVTGHHRYDGEGGAGRCPAGWLYEVSDDFNEAGVLL